LKRIIGLIILALFAAGVWLLLDWRNRPPVVEFSKATRETIVDLLSTNGKIEPVEWAAARNEVPGVVQKVLVRKGQTVAQGAPLIEIEMREAIASRDAAIARMAQINAELETLRSGGRGAEIATIDGSINSAKLELATAQREVTELERLVAKQAATPYELTVAKRRVEAAQVQVQSLQSRRTSLVSSADRSAAEARLREAESTKKLAEQQIALGVVRAPMSGVVYQIDLRAGDYVAPGTLVALCRRARTGTGRSRQSRDCDLGREAGQGVERHGAESPDADCGSGCPAGGRGAVRDRESGSGSAAGRKHQRVYPRGAGGRCDRGVEGGAAAREQSNWGLPIAAGFE
jgi:multidrug efflux pump subunit AcrA (membrane-fusion protein)